MKKLLSAVLTVGLLATGVVAYAAPSITEPENERDIEVEIHLGGFDPTTDGETPSNPDMWISVELPTSILIFSDGTATPAHSEFTAVDHTIRNFSARGVRVEVVDFGIDTITGNIAPITLLTINGADNGAETLSQELITGGAVTTIPENAELMTLPASRDGAAYYESGTFNFTGTINETMLGVTATQTDAELTLRLRPMNTETPSVPYETTPVAP